MSIFEWIRDLFAGTSGEAAESRVAGEIIDFMVSLIKDPELLSAHYKIISDAKRASRKRGNTALPPAYLELENVITSNRPPAVEILFTQETLRERIRKQYDMASLSPVFRLLFLPKIEQLCEIYKRGLKTLANYLVQFVGTEQVHETLSPVLKHRGLVYVLGESGLDLEALCASEASAQVDDLVKITKEIYGALYHDVSRLFDEEKALELTRKDYEFFRSTYGSGITSEFLSIVPEGVLDLERLAYMSREELERNIRERTEELRVLNNELEQKVTERTEELKEKVDLLQKREKELTIANKHLKVLDELKTEFVSVVAHQLRTPLAATRWVFSSLLDKNVKNLTPEQADWAHKGFETSVRMINLVNEMLEITRIESGNVKYSFAPIQIEDLIERMLFDFTGQAQERKIELIFNKPNPPLSPVRGDTQKLRAVVQNLLDNAIKYGKAGSPITINTTEHDGEIEVTVADNGIGIPEDQRSEIFTKFFRAQNAMRVFTDGSGLGLFVAKEIVLRHKGRIWFDSKENEGSTFHFTIPIAQKASK